MSQPAQAVARDRRGIATRYEKRVLNYRAMLVIAALVIWLTSWITRLRPLGYENLANRDDSWNEWGTREDLPAERGKAPPNVEVKQHRSNPPDQVPNPPPANTSKHPWPCCPRHRTTQATGAMPVQH